MLTTPIIRCIKKQLPDSEVHFLTKQAFRQVIENNPYIDNFFYLDNDIQGLVKRLRLEQYDYIVDLHHNIRSWLIKLRLHKKSFTIPKLNFQKWMLVNFKVNRMPHIHIVDRYFESVKNLNVINDGAGLDFFIQPHDEINITTYLPPEFHNGFLTFVIGAKHNTKCLPFSKINSICKKINKPVVLLGGKEDMAIGEEVARQNHSLVFNTCGKLTLKQSASILRQSEKVITHDTGLMHIAAAYHKKIISVWGNTVPAFGMYPYLGNDTLNKPEIIEVAGLSCRPCSKIGFDACPKKHFKCMNNIDEGAIVKLVS